MRIKQTLLLTLFLAQHVFVWGQDVINLSLKECIQMGIERNINVEKARLNKTRDAYKVSEVKSALLPTITGSGQAMNNLQLPYTILPGDMIGQPGTDLAVKMGVKYTAKLVFDANQVLYNQTAFTALKLAKRQDEINTLSIEKAGQDLAKDLIDLYFLAKTTARQEELVKDNIVRMGKVSNITEALYKNGMAKKVDFDRIAINLENMQTMLSNVQTLYKQQINMIKYTLEIPLTDQIVLTDSVAIPLLQDVSVTTTDFSSHVSIRMLAEQKQLNLLNQNFIKAGYLPSLSMFGQWGYQGMNNEFSKYFSGGNWYSGAYIGLSLSIPIFDGFEKRSKLRQAKITTKEADLTLNNTKKLFETSYKTAIENYLNNASNVTRQQNNISLAQRVYEETALKYREGMASMSDLIQDENSLNSAQDNYITALYNQKKAELEVIQLTGEINKYIK